MPTINRKAKTKPFGSKGRQPNEEKYSIKRFGQMASYPLFSAYREDPHGMARLFRRMPNMEKLQKSIPKIGLEMVRYILLVYDKKSPFKVEHHNLQERKAAVAAYCGFKDKSDENYIKLTELSSELVVDALCDFLKFQNDNIWSMIIQFEEVFLNNQRQIFLGVSGLGKDTDRMNASLNAVKLATANKSLAKEIKELYVQFTGNDPDAEAAIMQAKPLRPEMVADWGSDEPEHWSADGDDEEE